MFAKTVRGRIWTLIVLGLLLASLVPPAPAYAWPPVDDPGVSGAGNQNRTGLLSPTGQPHGIMPLGGGGEGCFSGCTRKEDNGLNEGDPVSANAGAYHFELPLLSLGGPMNLGFTLIYRSDFDTFTLLGVPERFWWSPSEFAEYYPSEGVATFRISNGDHISFYKEGDQWMPTPMDFHGYVDNTYPIRWVLQETDDYFYLMDPVGEQVHIFRKNGQLARIVDRNGNQLIYTYADEDDLNPTRIEDGLGRSLDLSYQRVGYYNALVRVTDQAGREVSLSYEEAAPDNDLWPTLRSVTDPEGHTTTFRYTPWHLITRVERPRGNIPYTQDYDIRTLNGNDVKRVVTQTDAYGNTTTFSYDPNAYRVTVTRPDSTTLVYEHYSHHGLPKSFTDPTGKTAYFGRDDENNRLTSLTDRMGDTTQVTYHPETGKLASYTDAEGNTTTFTYTPQEQSFGLPTRGTSGQSLTQQVTFTFYNLTRIDYPDGTHEEFTYDDHGNVTAYTDRVGNQWAFTYNDRGWLLTITNPEGGIITYTYNPDGTLASYTDSDTGLTTFAYDAYKRLSTITHPDGSALHFTYDLNDRLLTFTDERGKTTIFTYDANGNLITIANSLNQSTTYAYDLMDGLSSRIDPLGHASTYTYDALGRRVSFTDRNGHTITFTYDTRGWLTGVTNPAGHTWTTAYDDEGVPTAITTPLGHLIASQTDRLGRITTITDPLGATTYFTYDALGRLTSVTDRLGRTASYAYDAEGRLVGVTWPLIGTATYTRDDMGLLTCITDLRGKHWDFAYSPMGRLVSHTDPLGNRWTYAYDNRGRLQQISYPDGTSATFTYDAASNLTQVAYSTGPILNYTYDDVGRLLTANDLALAYDVRGDIVESRDGSASFGATYDAGRRLKTVTYDGLATVTYTYDERDLVVRVEDDLSGAWMEFAYDDDGRLTEIRRSNGVSTHFSYDDAGRVTRIHDVGANGGSPLADQQYTLNAEGDVVQVARTLPYDPLPVGQVVNFSYDDAGQITSPGYGYDARGRQTAAPGKAFAYDGASHLVSVTADGTTATLTYNGLGDLRTRTVDGATTHYYHNYALGLWPIVAEASAQTSGSLAGSRGQGGEGYKRFYVYTPGGALLYSMEPGSGAVRFYHFDRVGSTLFLTDGSGDVTDAYAYDPYGNLLGHTGTSDQPFTYVGQYGVRWEPVGGLYDMRARYYDPVAAHFLTRDPVWPIPGDLASLNPYQYVAQNPLRYIDPEGMKQQARENETAKKVEEIERRIKELEKNIIQTRKDIKRLREEQRQIAISQLGGIPSTSYRPTGPLSFGRVVSGAEPDWSIEYNRRVIEAGAPVSALALYSAEYRISTLLGTQISNARIAIRDMERKKSELERKLRKLLRKLELQSKQRIWASTEIGQRTILLGVPLARPPEVVR